MSMSFDSAYYLQTNPDVAQAVQNGTLPSAEFHFENFGAAEGRAPSASFALIQQRFNEQAYLDANADVAAAVQQGSLASGYQHWVLYGQFEGRAAATPMPFDQEYYLQNNPDVADAGVNPLAHFIAHGAAEGRAPSASYAPVAQGFDEQAYLNNNNDVAVAIQNGVFASGYEHWALYGQFEESRPEATYNNGRPASTATGNFLTVEGGAGMQTNFAAADLEGFQGIRFTGVTDGQTINLTGLANKQVIVENSVMALNFEQMNSSQLLLEGANVTLYGETDANGAPTGSLTSLAVGTLSNSTLNLGGSAAYGLANVTMGGSGNLALTGAVIGSGVTGDVVVDASAMSGNLTVMDNTIFSNATSVMAGSGNDILTMDDIVNDTIDGGAGVDTLTVTGSMTVPTGTNHINTNVNNIEGINFQSYVEVDANQFAGAESFVFASGGALFNLSAEQTVTATTAGGTTGSPLILRDAGANVNVVADFAASATDVLDLKVLTPSTDAAVGGTLTLSGSGAVAYAESGRKFDSIDASGLDGGLYFTGANYVQETITLGGSADTLAVVHTNASNETLPSSTYATMDVASNFAFGTDLLVDGTGTAVDFSTAVDVSTSTTLAEAFTQAGNNTAASNGYVSFVFEGSTYVYSDTETQTTDASGTTVSAAGLSDGDFAIQLVGAQQGATTLDSPA